MKGEPNNEYKSTTDYKYRKKKNNKPPPANNEDIHTRTPPNQ